MVIIITDGRDITGDHTVINYQDSGKIELKKIKMSYS